MPDSSPCDRVVDTLSHEVVDDQQVACATLCQLASAAFCEPLVVDEATALCPLEHLGTDRVTDSGAFEPHVERRPRVLAPRKSPQGDLLTAVTAPRPGECARTRPIELQSHTEAGLDHDRDGKCPPREAVELDGHTATRGAERGDDGHP